MILNSFRHKNVLLLNNNSIDFSDFSKEIFKFNLPEWFSCLCATPAMSLWSVQVHVNVPPNTVWPTIKCVVHADHVLLRRPKTTHNTMPFGHLFVNVMPFCSWWMDLRSRTTTYLWRHKILATRIVFVFTSFSAKSQSRVGKWMWCV